MKIKAIGVAFPKRVVDNSTIEKWCGLPAHTVAEKLGIQNRRFLDENETGTDLSEQAVLNLQKEKPDFDLSKIKLLIVVTQNPDYKLPHNSALLQARLGMPRDVACFDVSLGCSGYVYSLSIAKGFMKEAKADEALILPATPTPSASEKRIVRSPHYLVTPQRQRGFIPVVLEK